MSYEPVSIAVGGQDIIRYLRPGERAHALDLDAALALPTLLALPEGERQNYARGMLLSLFNTMLRRYPRSLGGPFAGATANERALFAAYAPYARATAPAYATPETYLVEAYRALSRITPAGQPHGYATGAPYNPDTSWQYRAITRLKEELAQTPHITSVMLHGSFGSRDALAGFSDLDLLLVLDDSAFESPKALHALRARLATLSLACYKIDPLAHHEFLIVTNLDLRSYARPLYPPELFTHGMCLVGPATLSIVLRDDRHERMQALFRTLHYMRRTEVHGTDDTAFSWKNEISTMLIWPTLLLEAHDRFLYKRESFAAVRDLYPDVNFSVFDRLTEVRRRWRVSNLVRLYPDTLLMRLPLSVSRRVVQLLKRSAVRGGALGTKEEREALRRDWLVCAEETFARTRTHHG